MWPMSSPLCPSTTVTRSPWAMYTRCDAASKVSRSQRSGAPIATALVIVYSGFSSALQTEPPTAHRSRSAQRVGDMTIPPDAALLGVVQLLHDLEGLLHVLGRRDAADFGRNLAVRQDDEGDSIGEAVADFNAARILGAG